MIKKEDPTWTLEELPENGKKHKKFTEEERAHAVQRVSEGEAVDSVATELGIAVNTLVRWGHRHGLVKYRFTDEERQHTVSRVQNGESLKDVAEELGLVPTTIMQWGNERGVNFPSERSYSKEIQEQAVQRARDGANCTDVSREMGIPAPTIWVWCRQQNVQFSSYGHQPEYVREKAVERVRNGETYAAVGRSIGVSVAAVMKWCRKKNVRSNPRHRSKDIPECLREQASEALKDGATYQKIRDTAIDMVRDGTTYATVARVLGVSIWQVSEWCRKEGVISVTKMNSSPEVRKQIQKRFREGAKCSQIVKEMNIPYATVKRCVGEK